MIIYDTFNGITILVTLVFAPTIYLKKREPAVKRNSKPGKNKDFFLMIWEALF